MAQALLPDDLWAAVAPLLPPAPRPGPKGGRPPVENRAALTGILFVLKSGIPWEMLPREMGCGCGMTCWRRLRDWQAAGVWARVHAELLARMHAAGLVDWSRASVDGCAGRAKRGVRAPGRARSTAARPAPSGTSWSMAGARRSA
jgi:transposase